MKITTISGSIRKGSKNTCLLLHLAKIAPQLDFQHYDALENIPLFHPDVVEIPLSVKIFKESILQSDALIISTPEYLHNIPAVLKNVFEWLTKTGELEDKPIIAICYTPHAPRGEKAMQSLLTTLLALKSNVLASINLYHTDIAFDENQKVMNKKGEELLKAALQLF